MSHWKLSKIGIAAALSVLTISSAGLLVVTKPAPATPPFDVQAAPSPTVTVATAIASEVAHSLTLIGSLVPRDEIQIGFDADGYRLAEVDANQGDEVKSGQILARLDTDRLDIQLAQNAASIAKDEATIVQAESVVAQMQSSAAEAEADLARANSLGIGNVITTQVMDQRVAAAKAAAAQLASAQAGLSAARADKSLSEAVRNNLMLTKDKTTIRSPCDGVVLSRAAEVGQLIASGSASMFRIARGGEFEAAVLVDEVSLMQVKPGQKVLVALADGTSLGGQVRTVAREVDKSSRLAEARITLEPKAAMSSGMFARAQIDTEHHQGIIVPSSAIVFDGQATVVRVLSGGKIETREVSIGVTTGARTEVTRGISAGETIVMRAGAFVHNGETVTAVADEGV